MPWRAVEGDGAAEEADRGRALSRRRALRRRRGGCSRRRRCGRTPSRRCRGARPAASVQRAGCSAALPPRDALAGAALDPAELLDVDVDELARPRALVADAAARARSGRAGPSRCRVRIAETVESGIASVSAISAAVIRSRRSATIAATRSGARAVGDPPRRRGAIEQTALALAPIAADPLARTAHADAGGLGRRRQRPSLHRPPAAPAAADRSN